MEVLGSVLYLHPPARVGGLGAGNEPRGIRACPRSVSSGHRMLPMGDQLWISALGEGDGGQIYRFRFDAAASRFEAADRFGNNIEAEPGDGFGATIAVSGDLAVVGQPGDDKRSWGQ